MKKSTTYCLLVCVFCFSLLSCEEILIEDDLTKKDITLVAPVNNAEFNSTSVAMTWLTVENATGYRLQIAKPDFANPIQIVLDTIVSRNTYAAQLNVGSYEWRVKAVNSAYETAFRNRFFTILSNENFADNIVTLSSPAANLITNSTSQNLGWQSVLGASNYQVQVMDNSSAILSDQTVTSTSLNYTFAQGNYQWRVRASNGTEQTLYTSRSILVDSVVPNTPLLSSPANATSLPDGDVTFQWTRTPVSGSVEKDIIYIYTNSALSNLHSQTETTSPYTVNLTAGTYYWYVKSSDEAGNVGAQSSVFSFTLN